MELKDLDPITFKLKNDLSGQKFNRIKIIKPVGVRRNVIYYWCKCDCGTEKIINGRSVVVGDSKSCGCLHKENNRTRKITHGMSRTTEYNSWILMKDRCLNKKNKTYNYYGGKHIRVCFQWLHSFETFYKDLGDKPSKECTIERINSNFNYTPWNCKWATKKEQSRNLKSNTNLTYKGKTQCLAAWSEELNISSSTLSARLNKLSWSVEKTLSTRPRKRRN